MTLSILEDSDDNHQAAGLVWEKPYFYHKGNTFIPNIFDARFLGEDPPSKEFNAVTVVLDGRCKSELNWKEAMQAAQKYIASGLFVLWELELGLFNQIKHPLSNQTQFLTLVLSIKHFQDTIWKEFAEHSLGLCFYRGRSDFYQNFKWDDISQQNFAAIESEIGSKQVFCQGAALEYWDLLTANVPDSLPLFVMVDTDSVPYSLVGRMLTHDMAQRFHFLIRGGRIASQEAGWEVNSPYGYIGSNISSKSTTFNQVHIGISMSAHTWDGLDELLTKLRVMQKPFRFIAESNLTMEWDGIDFLLVSSKSITTQGRRKLQGFCAAGGTVVFDGVPLGLSQEISFKEWFEYGF